MKNMMKAIVCALTLTAAVAAVPAMVSARDNKDVYISDSYALVLMEQPSYDSDIAFYADGSGYELHVQDYSNGFGYCYVPFFDVTGWVDLNDAYYDGAYDIDGDVIYDDGDYYDQTGEFFEILHSSVDGGFLALRSAPAYSDGNIIAEIWTNGTTLCMTGTYNGNYGYCYVPAFDMYGWVDVRFTY